MGGMAGILHLKQVIWLMLKFPKIRTAFLFKPWDNEDTCTSCHLFGVTSLKVRGCQGWTNDNIVAL